MQTEATSKRVEMDWSGPERLTMNMGPQHPSAHGVFRAIVTLEGETVVAVDAVIGYLHRCHEKLAETLTYAQYPSIASKTDYVAAMTSEFAYVLAAEEIGKFEVPKRAQYLRVICAELQRIASHLLWLGTWCMDMGGALGGDARILFAALLGANERAQAEICEREEDVEVLKEMLVVYAVVLLGEPKVPVLLKEASAGHMHVIVEILVHKVVGYHSADAAPNAGDARNGLDGYLERKMERHKQRQGEPIHYDVLFGAALAALVRLGRVFVSQVVDQVVRAVGRLNVLVRVEEVFVERPLEEAGVEEIGDCSEQVALNGPTHRLSKSLLGADASVSASADSTATHWAL